MHRRDYPLGLPEMLLLVSEVILVSFRSRFWGCHATLLPKYMKGVSARTYRTNYFQRLTLESWYINLQQTPLNRCQQVPAPYKRLILEKAETDKRTSNRRILLINRKIETDQ